MSRVQKNYFIWTRKQCYFLSSIGKSKHKFLSSLYSPLTNSENVAQILSKKKRLNYPLVIKQNEKKTTNFHMNYSTAKLNIRINEPTCRLHVRHETIYYTFTSRSTRRPPGKFNFNICMQNTQWAQEHLGKSDQWVATPGNLFVESLAK